MDLEIKCTGTVDLQLIKQLANSKMASKFLDRFKNKVSTITREGDFSIGKASPVNKSAVKSIIKQSGN